MNFIFQENVHTVKWPPILSNNLYYVTLILISHHSAFHIN